MRTKVSSSDEGGVAAGFAVLDSLYLTDKVITMIHISFVHIFHNNKLRHVGNVLAVGNWFDVILLRKSEKKKTRKRFIAI